MFVDKILTAINKRQTMSRLAYLLCETGLAMIFCVVMGGGSLLCSSCHIILTFGSIEFA